MTTCAVDALGGDGNPPRFCWGLVLVYVGLKFVSGGGSGGGIGSMGLLNNLRSLSWIKVQQFTSRLQFTSTKHIMMLIIKSLV